MHFVWWGFGTRILWNCGLIRQIKNQKTRKDCSNSEKAFKGECSVFWDIFSFGKVIIFTRRLIFFCQKSFCLRSRVDIWWSSVIGDLGESYEIKEIYKKSKEIITKWNNSDFQLLFATSLNKPQIQKQHRSASSARCRAAAKSKFLRSSSAWHDL